MNVHTAISAAIPDWSREEAHHFWDPGKNLLRSIRDYQRSTPALQRKIVVLRHRFWSIITQCEIDLCCQIGGGAFVDSS